MCTQHTWGSVEQKRASDSYNYSMGAGNQILVLEKKKKKQQMILPTESSLQPSYPRT